jgi:hypothetical protein
MFANAHELVLKPMTNNLASTTPGEWLHVHKAFPIAKIDWSFDNAGQRVVMVTFKAFPDTLSGQVGEIWRMGAAA